jgi:hydroxymethylpyrimidine pyrophosphatase-like HAD family hydrolase
MGSHRRMSEARIAVLDLDGTLLDDTTAPA